MHAEVRAAGSSMAPHCIRAVLVSHGRGLGFQALSHVQADGTAESNRWRRVVALMLGASPASATGHRSSAPTHQRVDAYVVAQEQVGPQLVDLTIQSPALGRTAKVRLLTPNGWEQRRRGDRWPVSCLLHGCCDTLLERGYGAGHRRVIAGL